MRRLTTEQFISQAKSVHGDAYCYSLVTYVNSKVKVKIKCRTHGVFYQTPNCHVSQKQGCPKCSSRGKMNTDNFIKHAKEIHGDTYDYSLSVSKNNLSKVVIKCTNHGEFSQLVSSHLSGHGCPKCANAESANNRRKPLSEFTVRALEVHKGVYDYSSFVYVNTNTKGSIICSTHGVFYQTPKEHLRGRGCPKCAVNCKLTTDSFTRKASEVHNDKYSYGFTEYVNGSTPVIITCPIHGGFIQKPSDHLSGNGCQSCAKGGYKENKEGFLYILHSEEHIKVGISNQPLKRFQDLKTETPFPFDVLDVLHSKSGLAVKCVESIIHNSFPSAGLSGFSGCTEWLTPNAELIECVYEAASVYCLKRIKLEDLE